MSYYPRLLPDIEYYERKSRHESMLVYFGKPYKAWIFCRISKVGHCMALLTKVKNI